MVEQVSQKPFFHVTVGTQHKTALIAGQTFTCGEAHNPFFAFYEGGGRYYPVDDKGQIVQVSAVAWLKRVNLGEIRPHNMEILANIATEVSMHYVMLARELIMEELRVSDFDDIPPSRQTCVYCCDTLSEAQEWKNLLGSGTVCELTCTGTIHRADSRLLLTDSEPLSVTKERGRQYWRGEVSAAPRMGKSVV